MCEARQIRTEVEIKAYNKKYADPLTGTNNSKFTNLDCQLLGTNQKTFLTDESSLNIKLCNTQERNLFQELMIQIHIHLYCILSTDQEKKHWFSAAKSSE